MIIIDTVTWELQLSSLFSLLVFDNCVANSLLVQPTKVGGPVAQLLMVGACIYEGLRSGISLGKF